MTNNYISQGKNYISSKRASEISDYSADYVGQLCRASKLDCHRVGHVWFVTEESLRAHMTRVWSDDALRHRANNLKRRFIQNRSTSVTQRSPSDEKDRITGAQAALLSGYAPDYIGQLCRSGKIDAVMVGKSWMVDPESLKAHMEKVKLSSNEITSTLSKSVTMKKVGGLVEGIGVIPEKKKTSVLTPRRSNYGSNHGLSMYLKRSALTLASIGILIIGGSVALVRFAGVQNDAVRQPLVASVYDTAYSINSLVSGRGLAVAPRTGHDAEDTSMKTAIRDSFSDQVDISTDQSGTAGVITPIFKKAGGKDFLYVMVPVKDSKNASSTVGNDE